MGGFIGIRSRQHIKNIADLLHISGYKFKRPATKRIVGFLLLKLSILTKFSLRICLISNKLSRALKSAGNVDFFGIFNFENNTICFR